MPHDFVRDIIPPDDRSKGSKRKPESDFIEDDVLPMTPEEPVRDIPSTPPPDRSIRNVQMPGKARPSVAPAFMHEPRSATPRRASNKGVYVWAAVAAVVIVGIGAFATLSMGKTTVSVVAKSQAVTFGDRTTILAVPNGSGGATADALTYQTVTQSAEDGASVKSSGVQHVEESASGSVLLFNSFSDAPVKLVKSTRLESPTGQIYRIRDDVSIPGRLNGKPGSLSVTAYADQVGAEYNSAALARLTLPGLKTSKGGMFDTVYASAPQGFTGGFKGERPGVDDGVLTATRTALRTDLETKARAALLAAVTEGSYLPPSLITVTFDSLPTEPAEDGNARIKEKVTASGPLFDAKMLAHALAVVSASDLSGTDIRLGDTTTFALSTAEVGLPPIYGTTPLTLYVSGKANFVWDVKALDLAKALAGHNTSEFQAIISTFPGVISGDASILPFWKHSFPADAESISVTVSEAGKPAGSL